MTYKSTTTILIFDIKYIYAYINVKKVHYVW